MAFSITAELPLGTYRGASPDGRVERIPSVARLHSALLCAAGFGPRAQPTGEAMGPCAADQVALRWLEGNPPDAVSIPAMQVNHGAAVAYRDDGTLKKSKTEWSTKKLPKSPNTSVAVQGAFTWTWSTFPPRDVVAALAALCPDVPYLGTSESPVRLTTRLDDVVPTHTLDVSAELFTGGGEDVELPVRGRVEELAVAHRAVTGKPPSVHQDAYGVDEKSSAPSPPRSRVALARYAPRESPPADVPWPLVLLLPLDAAVPERDRVRWAVAAHRALIAVMGDGAPSVVTGIYGPGVPRPSNRLALHFLDADHPVDLPGGASGALAMLLPLGAEPGDVQAVLDTIGDLRRIRGPRGALRRVVGPAVRLPGGQFWRERSPGTVRLWRTSPPAIPDTRGTGTNWTFAHAALLSLGFVWQATARLPAPRGRGEDRYRTLVGAVGDVGAAVLDAGPLRTSAVQDYVHRVNEHAVVRPYRAIMWLGDLGGDGVVMAIGQSRHLGGGLLVPFDVPEGSTLDRARDMGRRDEAFRRNSS
ncbi:MAG: type I-G CRISPR-associated protein Csb2 [Actinomycetes bacterium]